MNTRPQPDTPQQRTLVRVGAVVWPSFFAAGVATSVFFAVIDPLDLATITWLRAPLTRECAYTLGFFAFWSCTLASSLFTAWLLTPGTAPSPAAHGPP